MKYAQGIEEFVQRSNKTVPPDFYKRSLAEMRKLYEGLLQEFPYQLPTAVVIANDEVIHEGKNFPIRVYYPKQKQGNGLLIYIRGGGFVIGSLETHNSAVAELCEKSGLVAIAPDFRMAPEHPFPAALEDCYGALCGIVHDARRFDIDPQKIVICGDSSGANMAVSIAMMVRDRSGPKLRGQALISPVLDFTRWRQGGIDAPLLTGGEMEFFTACYAPKDEELHHPYVSQLINGSFHNLPPAYVMGAEMDSLLIDAQEYVLNLQRYGIAAELVVEPGFVHAAVRARGISPPVAEAWQRFCEQAAQLTNVQEVIYDN